MEAGQGASRGPGGPPSRVSGPKLSVFRFEWKMPQGARKIRLDLLLTEKGLAESREKAQALVLAGEVLVNGQKARKAGQSVPIDAALEVLASPRYVSRGGLKLEAAIDHFR